MYDLRIITHFSVFMLSIVLNITLFSQDHDRVSFIENAEDQEVKVMVGDQHITSYLYRDDIEKPVLYPIYSLDGKLVTRGYPYIPMEGERTDHPHHLGFWLNYGDVNGFDFWNNSSQIPAEKKDRYGEVRHMKILEIKEGKGEATLTSTSEWQSPHEVLLDDITTFNFIKQNDLFIIDRTTTLTARTDVHFKDNKEGMIAIRVTRAMELPSDGQAVLTDSYGKPKNKKESTQGGATADYLSSEGISGNDVWGTRATWMKLFGEIGGKEVSLIMIDHPDNVGYPTYWHARGYGLFAANPLGQAALSDGKEILDFKLGAGKSVTFKYRLVISDQGSIDRAQIEALEEEFTQ